MTRRIRELTITLRVVEEHSDPIDTTAEALDEEVSTITRALRPLSKCAAMLELPERRKVSR